MAYERKDIELISEILYSGAFQKNDNIENIFGFLKEIKLRCNESCNSEIEEIFRDFVKCGSITALKKYRNYKKENELSGIILYYLSENPLINITAKQLRYNQCIKKLEKRCLEWQLEKLYNGEKIGDIKEQWERIKYNEFISEDTLSEEEFNAINLLGGN